MTVTVLDPRSGRRINAMAPMVKARPPGGWDYSFTLKGISQKTTGNTPMEVLIKVKDAHKRNGVEFCLSDFWISANLQWMPQVNSKFHIAPLDAIKALQENEESSDEPDEKPRDRSWVRNAWGFIAIMLAQNSYDVTDLIRAVTMIEKMLDPKRNPETGDRADHGAALSAIEDLRNKPPATKRDARVWMFQFINSENRRLGKQPIRYQDYCARNNWK